ncbi:5'-methylthioadenosine/S-adenosylhomocysteine nucleosidase [Sphingomonas molluscorum]|uniref:5'-methylthioadenosine/S-adenosylhomocysteine nucleosidase family protein n=1 Tax=Sphingomonas molluscorum TaxID=418184 RepID=UPI0031D9E75F
MLRARRLFTHFFDIHLLAEKGACDLPRLAMEMRRAFRFALLLADHVMVPASSYFESALCRAILDEFHPDHFAEQISFVASGANLDEFVEGKLSQYGAAEVQGQAYRAGGLATAFPWHGRSRSSTQDIGKAWQTGMELDGQDRIARAIRDRPSDLDRRLAELPERLGRSAFIAGNAARILIGDAKPTLQLTNRLLSTINAAYFDSYALDLKAALVQELVWLGSSQPLPSGDPNHDIDYRALVGACRSTGVLGDVDRTEPRELLRLRDDERFVLACAAAAGTAQANQLYRGIVYSMPTIEVQHTPPRTDATKVLVVTALPEELAAVLSTCDAHRTIAGKGDRAIYRLCDYVLPDKTTRKVVVATLSDMGKANAAIVTATALQSFPDIEHVLMVGIAGGCPNPAQPAEHVRLGDIVISDHKGIFEYDDVKLKMGEVERRGSPQLPGYTMLQALAAVKADAFGGRRRWEEVIDASLPKLREADDSFERPDPSTDVLHVDGKAVEHPEDKRRRPGRPRVFGGGVATGDALVKDPKLRDELRDRYGARAIEMEGSAVRTASWAAGKDSIIVRGVSDYCDQHKNDEWRFSAALAAAAYARALIEVMPAEWFE